MGRRSEIVSPKYILRDMVLKRGGAMGLTQILGSRTFRGREANEIRQLVYQLRKKNKGSDFGYGVEAWELLDRVVIGLERCLTPRMRWQIQKRRHAKVKGVDEQTVLDNRMFEAKIKQNGVVHKDQIIRKLGASTKALDEAGESSTDVREMLVEHDEEFGKKD